MLRSALMRLHGAPSAVTRPLPSALARPLLRSCSGTGASSGAAAGSSVDDQLKAALAKVAEAVARQDPAARTLADGVASGEITGATRTAGPKMILRFTCTHEDCMVPAEDDRRITTKIISKGSYEKGIVVVRCDCCDKQHLIADRLGWFGERPTDIEEILAERGEEVRRMLSDGGEAGEEVPLHIEK